MNALTAQHNEAPASWALRFTLGDWNNRASVRTRHNNYQLPDDLHHQLETRHWFPPTMLPYLSHPAIEAAGRAVIHRLTANHLVYFLDCTTLLEHRIVNRAIETIIHGELPAFVPSRMKTAALQLRTDEAYHALCSNNLAEQIAKVYDMTERPAIPLRITRFNALMARTPEQHRALAWFLLGFVSETTIAHELHDICRDSLVSGVHDMLRDQLSDEAHHSRYFTEVFHYLWLTLNSRQRTFTARTLLDIIGLFFETDERWLQQSLRGAGIAEDTVVQITGETTTAKARRSRARAGARATLDALDQAGFFAIPLNQKLFAKAGLTDA